jgi:hypothetical protein
MNQEQEEQLSTIVDKLLSKAVKEDNAYMFWLVMYIAGDRRKADSFLKLFRGHIIAKAKALRAKYGVSDKKLYRGILLDPGVDVEKHNMNKFDHISFTENIELAEAFATADSQYGIAFPNSWKGYVYELGDINNSFIWFDYSWAKHIDEDLEMMIKLWNQQEILIGNIDESSLKLIKRMDDEL